MGEILPNRYRNVKKLLSFIFPHTVGIDVSSTEMQVCIPEDRNGDNNRCCGTFTCDFHEISARLKACKIDTIAMESIGVYCFSI